MTGELSPGDEEDLFIFQGQGCAICGREPTPFRKLALDHHHVSGEVRGYLCGWCNVTIGYLKEDAEWMHRAALYLEYPPSRQCWEGEPRWWPDSPGAEGFDLRETP